METKSGCLNLSRLGVNVDPSDLQPETICDFFGEGYHARSTHSMND